MSRVWALGAGSTRNFHATRGVTRAGPVRNRSGGRAAASRLAFQSAQSPPERFLRRAAPPQPEPLFGDPAERQRRMTLAGAETLQGFAGARSSAGNPRSAKRRAMSLDLPKSTVGDGGEHLVGRGVPPGRASSRRRARASAHESGVPCTSRQSTKAYRGQSPGARSYRPGAPMPRAHVW